VITADTITDEQIRELMVQPGLVLRNTCLVALTHIATPEVRNSARAYCAEQWNARLAERIRDLRDNGPRTIDVLNDCDMALAALRGEFGAGRLKAEQALARCAERLNARRSA
jgi:hypothetical protein